MQEINWNNFAAKFNGKEQSSFEWLCYLLFCDEYSKPTGMLRYKNQAGIETEPIEYKQVTQLGIDIIVVSEHLKTHRKFQGKEKDKIRHAFGE